MKKVLVLIMVLCFTGQSWGQESLKTIHLDFKNKRFYGLNGLEDLKNGDYYQLKIDSINMNLFRIVFDKKDTIIVSSVTLPTFDLVNLGGVGELLGKIVFSATSVSDFMIESNRSYDSLKAYLLRQIYIDKKQAFNPKQMSNNDFDELAKQLEAYKLLNNQTIKEIIETRIIKEKLIIISKDSMARSYQKEIDNLQIAIQKKIYSYSVLDKSNNNYQSLSGDLSFESMLVLAERLRTSIKSLSLSLTKQQSEYLIFTSNENIKKTTNDDKNKELKEADKNLTEAFIITISNADKLYESVNSEKVTAWIKELIYRNNNATFSYTSLPQQLNGDQTKISIQLIPAKEEYGLPDYRTEFHFPQKREFYVGVGMSFYYAEFINEMYSTKATVVNDSVTNYQIVDEKNKEGELGLATLIHFGWRPFYDKDADWFGINIVTGPALSLTNPIKPRIAAGVGLAFGRKNMLTINGIYMGGYVEKKSEVFNSGATYSTNPNNVTVSKLEGSFGISMGYIYKF